MTVTVGAALRDVRRSGSGSDSGLASVSMRRIEVSDRFCRFLAFNWIPSAELAFAIGPNADPPVGVSQDPAR